MGVKMERSAIAATLDAATYLAETHGELFSIDDAVEPWIKIVRELQEDAVPKTYLAVAVTLLTARATYGDSVDATFLKSSAGPQGFSASTVGAQLAGHAKAHDVDLRSTSTSPFNNQPFTFEERLDRIQPKGSNRDAFNVLLHAAESINQMSRADAARALAATFVVCRRIEALAREVGVVGGSEAFRAVCRDVEVFVVATSDGGRVGQAFCAALLDLAHDNVMMGAVNDPDRHLVGDVHVGDADHPWLWCEVKQKPIVLGDIHSFMRKVSALGGERCLYLALANTHARLRIDPQDALVAARGAGVDLILVQDAHDAIELLTRLAPGDYADLASRLLSSMRARILESNAQPSTLLAFDAIIDSHDALV